MTDSEKLDLILSRLEKLDKLENDITDIKLTLENEIRVNIQRVAEGHLDLSRNLHEALKIDNEKEMLAIRVSVLETELRRIKAKLEIAWPQLHKYITYPGVKSIELLRLCTFLICTLKTE